MAQVGIYTFCRKGIAIIARASDMLSRLDYVDITEPAIDAVSSSRLPIVMTYTFSRVSVCGFRSTNQHSSSSSKQSACCAAIISFFDSVVHIAFIHPQDIAHPASTYPRVVHIYRQLSGLCWVGMLFRFSCIRDAACFTLAALCTRAV